MKIKKDKISDGWSDLLQLAKVMFFVEMEKIRSLMVAVARINYPMPLTFLKLGKPAESRHFSKGQKTKYKTTFS